jgi:signal peptidase I
MKRVINFLVSGAIVLGTQTLNAQSADEARMNRDIEITENILSTLIKQEFTNRNFFPIDVRGSYRSGYGVTFTIPADMMMPVMAGSNADVVILDGTPGSYSYSFSTTPDGEEKRLYEKQTFEKQAEKEKMKAENETKAKSAQKGEENPDNSEWAGNAEEWRVAKVPGVRVRSKGQNRDSLLAVSNAKIIQAAKNFLADYGDLISQLKADEKIIITNQGDNHRWYYGPNAKRSIVRVEGSKGDLVQYRQGKITRDQLLSKIKVTNTESTGKMEPDLELLTSIFNRLYSSDLSSTFFLSGNSYYERLNDYGAIIYMQVYSSNQTGEGLFNMPTVDLRDLDQAARDKKAKELYPAFENELKENILEYGRTVKSLMDNEQLVFNVTITKCKGCGIPADIEVAVPSSVLKDYNLGKVEKNSALTKVMVRKGASQ